MALFRIWGAACLALSFSFPLRVSSPIAIASVLLAFIWGKLHGRQSVADGIRGQARPVPLENIISYLMRVGYYLNPRRSTEDGFIAKRPFAAQRHLTIFDKATKGSRIRDVQDGQNFQ